MAAPSDLGKGNLEVKSNFKLFVMFLWQFLSFPAEYCSEVSWSVLEVELWGWENAVKLYLRI